MGKLASDQPMTGLDRAVWWTEYVIRHKEKNIFRSRIHDIPLYQYLLLDVIGLIFIALLVVVFITLLLLKIAYTIFEMFKAKEKLKMR